MTEEKKKALFLMKQRGGKEDQREKDSGRGFRFQNTPEALPEKICFSWNRGRAVLLTGPKGQKESAVFLVKHRARIQV